MPRWTRLDSPPFCMGNPERDYVERMAPRNAAAATRLLMRLRTSNSWRQMSAEGLAHVRSLLPAQIDLLPCSGLLLADRIELPGNVSVLAWFAIDRFWKDPDPEAAEVDHAALLTVWLGPLATHWGDESAILDLVMTPPEPGHTRDRNRRYTKTERKLFFNEDVGRYPRR